MKLVNINFKNSKLLKILSEGKATKLVVEKKDILSRYGVSYIEIICKYFTINDILSFVDSIYYC